MNLAFHDCLIHETDALLNYLQVRYTVMSPDKRNVTTTVFSNLKRYLEETSTEIRVTAFWLNFTQRAILSSSVSAADCSRILTLLSKQIIQLYYKIKRTTAS